MGPVPYSPSPPNPPAPPPPIKITITACIVIVSPNLPLNSKYSNQCPYKNYQILIGIAFIYR